MYDRTLFIGNGFDLSIGMPTRYIDFARSEYWPSETYGSRLAIRLEDVIENRPNWFDIENIIDIYAKEQDGKDPLRIKADEKFFLDLKRGLINYLKDIERPYNCLHSTPALKFLESISKSSYFKNIYSFNYTSLEAIAHCKNIELHSTIRHLHGSLRQDEITLGTTDESIYAKGYYFLIKSLDPSYSVSGIVDSLKYSKELAFGGLSFGAIDLDYFKKFFISISNGEYTDTQKKTITIITFNKDSQKSILDNLMKAGISVGKLQQNSDFRVFRTDVNERNDDYYEYLEECRNG